MSPTLPAWLRATAAALALLAVQLLPAAAASELPAGMQAQRELAGIAEYRLANGLQLLLMPRDVDAQTHVTVIYKVGARHEGPGESGMAHLLEHMSYRGTAANGDLGEALRRLGVSYNGTTTQERTNYLGSFAASGSTLRELLRLEAARMTQARLAEADFLKEKPLVLNEMSLRGVALPRQLAEAMHAGAFRLHPYGRSVGGTVDDIEALSLATLRRFYTQHYRPDNAVLMISGRFDTADALAAVAETFGALPAAPAPQLPAIAAEPAQSTPRLVTLRTRSTALALGWRVPGAAHADTPALLLLQQWLANATQDFARQLGQPYNINVIGVQIPSRDPHSLGLLLHLPERGSATAEERRALESLEERWLNHLYQATRTRPPRAGVRLLATEAGRRLRQQLQDPSQAPAVISDAVGAGDWRLPLRLIETLPKLEPAALSAVAERYLREENRVLVRGVTDESVAMAPRIEDQALGFFARLFSRSAEVGEVADPSQGLDGLAKSAAATAPAAAASRSSTTARADAATPQALQQQLRRYQMPSGMQVLTLERPNADERVTLTLELRWGSAEAMQQEQAWRALNLALLSEGAGSFSANEIRRLRLQLQLDLQLISSPQQLRLVMVAKRGTLLQGLALLGDLLQRPEMPDAVFQRSRQEALARLAAQARSPQQAAQEQLRAHLNRQLGLQPGMPDYLTSHDEQVQAWKSLDIAQLRRFRERFWSANEARVVVVGALPQDQPIVAVADAVKVAGSDTPPTPKTLLVALERWIGDWKRPEAPAHVPAVAAFRPVEGARFTAPDDGRGSAQVLMHQLLPLQRGSADHAAMELATRVLSSPGVGGRLAARLRQQDALSYTVSASLQLAQRGDRARLNLQASGAPDKLAQVEAAIRQELARLLDEGMGADEFEQARRELLAERQRRLLNDGALAALLLQTMDDEAGPLALQAREQELLQTLDAAAVQQTARRLLLPQRWLSLLIGLPPADAGKALAPTVPAQAGASDAD